MSDIQLPKMEPIYDEPPVNVILWQAVTQCKSIEEIE